MEADGGGASLEWTSAPMDAPLHYGGQPRFTFTATVQAATPAPMLSGTHFAVHLIDVAPDGTERIINRGYLDAQHRNTLNMSEPVPQGQPVAFSLRFFPQDDVIPAAHSIRLRLGAVDDWIQPDGSNAQVRITIGGETGAAMTLPMVDDATARFFTPPSVPATR
ncbi:MAG TPA: CocE/NonD family hydrolase C-terminal non-catalytic domain-containing protein, partial [Candidatus Thermoplasmatota archaeon]